MLSAQLKAFTGDAHGSLEKKIVRKLKTISSHADYYRILSLFYGYYAGLENRISTFLDSALLPDYHRRRKSGALARDLAALGQTAGVLPVCSNLPVVESPLQAMGALYVLEGSTLGGQVISRMIARRIDVSEGGLSFFDGYGPETPHMWAIFLERLNQLQLNAGERQEVLEAANNTFVKFENWVTEHGG